MRLNLYSIFDVKAGVYLVPFPARSDVDAKRQIQASMRTPDMQGTPVFTHPEDFTLTHVGLFDDVMGDLQPVRPIATLSTISALIAGDSSTVPS